jgi:hypothetical protein
VTAVVSRTRTGVAAILAGTLYFVGHGGELAFDEAVPEGVYVATSIAGFIALAVALWGLRPLVSGTRRGQYGIRIALVGVGFLLLFAVQVAVELVRTGDIPENFILFALGLLLILVGQVVFAHDLRPTLGRGWVIPIVGVVGLVLALFLNSVGLHDIGLFVFEAAWVALGIALLRAVPAAPARVDAFS